MNDSRFDFMLPIESEYDILEDDRFDFVPDFRFTPEWYAKNFAGFDPYVYAILGELSGVPCNRDEIRKVIKLEKKRIKKLNKKWNRIKKALISNKDATQDNTISL